MTETSSAISILLVDDDPVDREAIRRSLVLLEPSIKEAETGSDFLNLAKEKCDIILLDQVLPDGKGTDFAQKAKSLGVKTPMILVTGFGNEELKTSAEQMGFLGYINKKDISPKSLSKLILDAFEIHRQQMESYLQQYHQDVKSSREVLQKMINRFLEIKHLAEERVEYYKNHPIDS